MNILIFGAATWRKGLSLRAHKQQQLAIERRWYARNGPEHIHLFILM